MSWRLQLYPLTAMPTRNRYRMRLQSARATTGTPGGFAHVSALNARGREGVLHERIRGFPTAWLSAAGVRLETPCATRGPGISRPRRCSTRRRRRPGAEIMHTTNTEIIGKVTSLGVENVVITGGEPPASEF